MKPLATGKSKLGDEEVAKLVDYFEVLIQIDADMYRKEGSDN